MAEEKKVDSPQLSLKILTIQQKKTQKKHNPALFLRPF